MKCHTIAERAIRDKRRAEEEAREAELDPTGLKYPLTAEEKQNAHLVVQAGLDHAENAGYARALQAEQHRRGWNVPDPEQERPREIGP